MATEFPGFLRGMHEKHPDLIQIDENRDVLCKDLEKVVKYHYKWQCQYKVSESNGGVSIKGKPSKQRSEFELDREVDCFKKACKERGKVISSSKNGRIMSCIISILDEETWKYLCENVRLLMCDFIINVFTY